MGRPVEPGHDRWDFEKQVLKKIHRLETPRLTPAKCIGISRYMEKTDAIEALGALAQEARLDIFRLLVRSGEAGLPAGAIAEALNLVQNTCSTHLAVLRRAGLIFQRRAGRQVIYAADFEGMRALIGFLMKDCCAGAPARVDPLLETLAPIEGDCECPVSTSR